MPSAPTLEVTQRLLWRLITAPEGAAAGIAGLAAEDPVAAALIEQIIASDQRLTAVERVDVYANMYFYRLLESLGEDYPGVRAAAGEVEFHNLVTDYLLAHPPSHPSLRYAGRHMASFLRLHRLAESSPFLPDLARLEWAIIESFDAADDAVLRPEQLETIPSERWAEVRFTPVASLQLLEVGWNVQDAWNAAQNALPLPELEASAASLQVWRRELRVFHRPLTPLERECMRGLLAREPFGAWCERAVAIAGEDASPGRRRPRPAPLARRGPARRHRVETPISLRPSARALKARIAAKMHEIRKRGKRVRPPLFAPSVPLCG